MPGEVLVQQTSYEHDHRWRPLNLTKNSRLTIQIHVPDSDKRINVPEKGSDSNIDLQSYFEEAPLDQILGSTTLSELIKKVKKDIPALYLWDEVGGACLACGPNHIFQSEWDTTMIWELISEPKENTGVAIPHVKLDDGRDAIVVTIGTPEQVSQKASVVTRCLAKGDTYG